MVASTLLRNCKVSIGVSAICFLIRYPSISFWVMYRYAFSVLIRHLLMPFLQMIFLNSIISLVIVSKIESSPFSAKLNWYLLFAPCMAWRYRSISLSLQYYWLSGRWYAPSACAASILSGNTSCAFPMSSWKKSTSEVLAFLTSTLPIRFSGLSSSQLSVTLIL